MTDIQHIYETIECNGFADSTLHLIDNYINDIQNGRTDFPRFTQPEHAGLCTAGAPLLGASIVASYATASLGTSGDASGGEGIRPPSPESNPNSPSPVTTMVGHYPTIES